MIQHLGHLALPGCGPHGRWRRLGRWTMGQRLRLAGVVPRAADVLRLSPAAGYASLSVGSGVPLWYRWCVRTGVLGSLFFVGVMALERHLCPYCLVAHVANIAFWLVIEFSPSQSSGSSRRSLVFGILSSVAVTAGLAITQSRAKETASQQAEAQLQQSIERIRDHLRAGAATGTVQTDGKGFTGRFRRGPERAALRLVVFSDYQCKDCRSTEEAIDEALAGRPDISISHKHFPLCKECNRIVRIEHFHDHACRAAQAAEAAGLLGGNDAFCACTLGCLSGKRCSPTRNSPLSPASLA